MMSLVKLSIKIQNFKNSRQTIKPIKAGGLNLCIARKRPQRIGMGSKCIFKVQFLKSSSLKKKRPITFSLGVSTFILQVLFKNIAFRSVVLDTKKG